MYQNILTKTLLTISLLTCNLSATNLCSSGTCMVDLSTLKPEVNYKTPMQKDIKEDAYEILIIENTETIVFSETAYQASEDEVVEYELSQLAKSVEDVILAEKPLPSSEYFCEENLKVVMIEESEQTYICA